MKIADDWKHKDLVTGIEFSIIPGEKMSRIHLEKTEETNWTNRDLFFMNEDGAFDGTGAEIRPPKPDED